MTALAWTSDGYGLAVGYDKAWAVWSMGGRLGGWGMSEAESDNQRTEGFMDGVIDLVCSKYSWFELMYSFGHQGMSSCSYWPMLD